MLPRLWNGCYAVILPNVWRTALSNESKPKGWTCPWLLRSGFETQRKIYPIYVSFNDPICRPNYTVSSDKWNGKYTEGRNSRVEAGSNTSTVTLRVVGGDEKGSFKSETVKYGHESHGTWTREWLRWRGPGAIVNDRPVLSSGRAPHINKSATVWQ
jgi:hypothetical protein